MASCDNDCAVLNAQSQCVGGGGVMVPDDHEWRGDGFGGGLAVAADIPRFVACSEFRTLVAKVIFMQNYILVV